MKRHILHLCMVFFVGGVIAAEGPKLIFTVEWYDVTCETYSTVKSVLEACGPVYIAAWTPLLKSSIYACVRLVRFSVLDHILVFVRRNTRVASKIRGMRREETL